jgi:hypothetical protein
MTGKWASTTQATIPYSAALAAPRPARMIYFMTHRSRRDVGIMPSPRNGLVFCVCAIIPDRPIAAILESAARDRRALARSQ